MFIDKIIKHNYKLYMFYSDIQTHRQTYIRLFLQYQSIKL